MDVNAPGLRQWTMESALNGHPVITVQAAPGLPIEVTLVCQSLTIGALDANSLALCTLAGGGNFENADGGEISVRRMEEDPMVLHIEDANGDELHLHTLDVRGFNDKLLEAERVSARKGD